MKKTIATVMLLFAGLVGIENAGAGWIWPSQRYLDQLRAACDGFYLATSEEKKRVHLRSASDALTLIKTEDHITEQKIIATLEKYKTIRPESVAVVILALDAWKPTQLEALHQTVATPSAVAWANQMVERSGIRQP